MTHTHTALDKTFRERTFHALAPEGLAALLTAPVLSLVMNKPLAYMDVLMLMFSTMVMLRNMLFGSLFDRAQRRMGFQRTLQVRVLHAIPFGLGLIMVLVPLAVWRLLIGLVGAFLLDTGLILFFPPYTMVFSWSYSVLRAYLMESCQTKVTGYDTGQAGVQAVSRSRRRPSMPSRLSTHSFSRSSHGTSASRSTFGRLRPRHNKTCPAAAFGPSSNSPLRIGLGG